MPGTDKTESHETDGPSSLMRLAREENDVVLSGLGTTVAGLSSQAAAAAASSHGPNEISRGKRQSDAMRLLLNFRNPLVLLLLALCAVSWLTGDLRSASVIMVMVALGVVLRFFQERRADNASERLQKMVSNTASALRDGKETELPLALLVPGDIVSLVAGDMVPADAILIGAKDLFVNQSSLTGEALPVEKSARPAASAEGGVLDCKRLCFLGSSVVSGSGTAVIALTGKRTYLGSLAVSVAAPRGKTGFDAGIDRFTWLMIGLIAVMVPAVFLINGLRSNDWIGAFFFATAVAVGLTPEMLPMIVTVNLSKGALSMAKKKVIVKRLNSIQNFGAMDVLCTDKTGTLTEGKIVLEKHLDVYGEPNEKVLEYGYLNSFHHTGLKNILDQAILDHEELGARLDVASRFRKIDEIPFDFVRRRMSVVVEDASGLNTLICKGAVEEVLGVCTRVEVRGEIVEILPDHDILRRKLADGLNAQGFRVLALAYRTMPDASDDPVYGVKDESDLILLGFLAFLDPPKESAKATIARLGEKEIGVKVLTGDNEILTAFICREVGVPDGRVLLGAEIDAMDDADLASAAGTTGIFARLTPAHKERVVRALQVGGAHVVGFLGDGINDAPALKAADVGISVSGAADIAKESSDIILLENSLLVLEQGVVEGRRVFGNIVKYIKMSASSNFGNVLSVVAASAVLPFLPMLPIQVLANNLLYDLSQTAIPSDRVDEKWLRKPRQWAIGRLLRFILFIGPVSSLFDCITFAALLYAFGGRDNPALFHTGWFVESLCTQAVVIHVIRTDGIPVFRSRASAPLALSTLAVVAAGIFLTLSPLAPALGFVSLPAPYWAYLALIVPCYAALTQLVKVLFISRFGE